MDLGGMQQGDNRQAQAYYALAEVYDTGPQVEMAGSHLVDEDWFLKPPYAEGGGSAFGQNPTVSVTEAYVTPFDRFVWDGREKSRVSELYPGKIIGLSITVSDRDTGEWNEMFYYILGGGLFEESNYSQNFPDFLLLGPGGEFLDDSAVESITWGRIKATFVK